MASDNLEIGHKPRKRRWDAALVGVGMTIAFSLVMMRLMGYFPCDIVNALQLTDADCESWVGSSWNTFVERFQETFQIL